MKRTGTCYVMLGKLGDLVQMLPVFQHECEESGIAPTVMVEAKHAGLFDGVGYVSPWVTELKWPSGITSAREEAERAFEKVLVPQFWNDTQVFDRPPSTSVLKLNGREWKFDMDEWPNCQSAMWGVCGLGLSELRRRQVIFNRRDPVREQALAGTVSNWKKPVILYNLQGESCPFGLAPEILRTLWPLRHLLDLVDLSAIKAHRFYDLLGLYDRAAGLLTIDTATLHLASASTVPVVALVNDGWSRAEPKGSVIMAMNYSQVTSRITEITEVISHLALLRRNRRLVDHYDIQNPPSILHQTAWPVRFITELPKDAEYFNCGLVDRPDGRFLLARRALPMAGHPWGINSVVAFRMEQNKVVGDGVQLKMVPTAADEHFEDPRALFHKGQTWVSCCNFVWGKTWTGAHQMICRVNDGWLSTHRYDVAYGRNGNHVGRNTGMEKNWLWFFHEDRLHLIYTTQPHLVVEFDASLNPVKEHSTLSRNLSWPYGEPRGGTPPVLVDGEYWSFFHSSTPWPEQGTRRYHMGAYAFEAKPPFRKTRCTRLPILSGSQHDHWSHPKPLVVFPCGALMKDGRWTVSLGVNDLNCALMEIPHDELVKLTTPIEI